MEIVGDDTTILVVSDHGAQRLDGGFAVNEWLRREGLLVLKQDVTEPTAFSPALVDWSKTKVWSEGGYYARVFFNVQGREPEGVIPPEEYEAFQDEMKAKFESIPDDRGNPMGTLVYKPQEIYKTRKNVVPDLIVHFGALYWRSIGQLGTKELYLQENDTGPDDCNHAQYGVFILSSPRVDVRGEVDGIMLLDIAPTLLETMGQNVPASMQGTSLLKKVGQKV
jgi:predicted AlkP superfamily phosphohydrolase/phosphomutase